MIQIMPVRPIKAATSLTRRIFSARSSGEKPREHQHSHFAISYLIIWHALLDSFFNEQLALSEFLIKEKNPDDRCIKLIRDIISSSLNIDKIPSIWNIYNMEKLDDDIISDIKIVFNLRDIVYHLEQSMAPRDEFPLEQFLV